MKNRLIPFVLVLIMAGIACGPTGTLTPPPALPTATPTPDPLADWLTYANADCSFEIRVPPGSTITPGADSDIIGLPSLREPISRRSISK